MKFQKAYTGKKKVVVIPLAFQFIQLRKVRQNIQQKKQEDKLRKVGQNVQQKKKKRG